MDPMRITLFGRFIARRDGEALDGFSSQKVQELFCYLVLHRDRPLPREMLASVLWDYCSTKQSKAYLRRVLWQLQQALLDATADEVPPILLVDNEWVQLNPEAHLWIDVAAFEAAYDDVRGVAGRYVDHGKVQALRAAVDSYAGDLLENWYHDWCLFERERLQNMYLALLDKLMDYCEAHREYELGLDYGERILRVDRAREHTHRRLMQLRYLTGDRTGALRQYERCTAVLDQELGVQPGRSTRLLHEQIRMDRGADHHGEPLTTPPMWRSRPHSLPDHLDHLLDLHQMVTSLQMQIQQEIETIEHSLQRAQSA